LGRNERLQQRVDILTEQNRQQRQQLERTYAELRRLQTTQPRPTSSVKDMCPTQHLISDV